MFGRKFVSEDELVKVRKQQQEEWERTRKDGDPLGTRNGSARVQTANAFQDKREVGRGGAGLVVAGTLAQL